MTLTTGTNTTTKVIPKSKVILNSADSPNATKAKRMFLKVKLCIFLVVEVLARG